MEGRADYCVSNARGHFARICPLALLALFLATGCSIRKVAIRNMADALAQGGTTFSSDDDPDLVKAALPFSLKLMETLLSESPRHQGLLLATSSGFTQYAWAFVQQDADKLETRDVAGAERMRARARRLYRRARDYALRGLEIRHRRFERDLRANPKSAVAAATAADVPLLYWAATSWGSEISLSKDNPGLVAEQPVVEALIDRALKLDEGYDQGSIHSFLITYEPSRQGAPGDPLERSRKHFDRAMDLSGGHRAAPLVAMAEAVSVARQDRREFEELLQRALAVDVNARPEWRLANLVVQRRARWLLSRVDELILGDEK